MSLSSPAYFKEIGKLPVLSHEEQRALITQYINNKSKRAKDKLVLHNLKLVIMIAKRYHVTHGTFEDLIQEGNIGLMRAVELFDLSKNVKFTTYASIWIKARILRYIVENSQLVKLGTSTDQRKLIWSLNKTKAKLSAQGVEITNELLAKEIGVSVDSVKEMNMRLSAPTVSINTRKVGDDVGTGTGELDIDYSGIRVDNHDPGPSAKLEDALMQQKLRELLLKFKGSLRKNEKIVFERRFLEDEKATFNEISAECGFTRQRAQQLDTRLKIRLKKFLQNSGITA